jgi:hypothetical protein
MRFDAAFDKAAANITEPGEAEIIAAIRTDRDVYYRLFDAFLWPKPIAQPGIFASSSCSSIECAPTAIGCCT